MIIKIHVLKWKQNLNINGSIKLFKHVNERKLKIKIKLEMREYFGSLIICSLRKMKNPFSFSILHSHHQIIETARQNEFCSLLSTSIHMTRHLILPTAKLQSMSFTKLYMVQC